jgi:hypothetical protein
MLLLAKILMVKRARNRRGATSNQNRGGGSQANPFMREVSTRVQLFPVSVNGGFNLMSLHNNPSFRQACRNHGEYKVTQISTTFTATTAVPGTFAMVTWGSPDTQPTQRAHLALAGARFKNALNPYNAQGPGNKVWTSCASPDNFGVAVDSTFAANEVVGLLTGSVVVVYRGVGNFT